MNNKLLLLLGFSLVVLVGCTTKESSSDASIDTVIQTGEVVVITGSVATGESESMYDDYAPVSTINQIKVGEQRIPGNWFTVNDKNWKGMYYSDRNWIYVGTMGVQSADVFYGYISGNLYMDFNTEVIQLPVDEKTYISYNAQLENPYYPGTGSLQVEDKKNSYQVCKDGYSMQQEEVVYDRDRYEDLLEKNPIRCFGEDKTYIYGRRQYGQGEGSGYELMRIKK